MLETIKETAEWLRAHTELRPHIAIILGTGLGHLASEIDIVDAFPYADVPHFPVSTVEGHQGRLLFGRLGGQPVMALDGRFHYYEGYSMTEVTFPVRVMHELGIDTLFVSNAAGGMNPDFEIGDLMDRQLLAMARDIAAEKGIRVREGVYLGTSGPTFETPAEYRMFRILGADAVGMSTVPEVIVARHSGIRVFGISVITDLGVEGKIVEVSHEEVQRAANAVQPLMADIFRTMIARLDA